MNQTQTSMILLILVGVVTILISTGVGVAAGMLSRQAGADPATATLCAGKAFGATITIALAVLSFGALLL